MKAITTKYLGPTNTKGSRIKATDNDGNTVTIPYAYGAREPHDVAAQAFLDKMGWSGEWVSGQTKPGEQVYVLVGDYRLSSNTAQ